MRKNKNKALETKSIFRFKDNRVKEEVYTEKSIDLTLGRISNEIMEYKQQYGKEPEIILISQALEIIFEMQMKLMEQCQMIMLNNKELKLHYVFGIPCITTPALDGLEFEVR